MNLSLTRGFSLITLIIVLALAGISFLIKDSTGTSYGMKAYDMGYQLTVGRGTDAMQQAQEAKVKLQAHEKDLQDTIDSN